MRASLFSAAVAAALAFTAWSPREAQAQIIFYPSISGSPYTSYGYAYPYYYGYNYPVVQSSYYTWNTPYSSWSWYNSYPSYTYPTYYGNYWNTGYWGGGRYYRGGYRGWRW